MPNPKTATAPGKPSRLSKCATALSAAAGFLLIALLISLYLTPNFVVEQSRAESGVVIVEEPMCRELEAAGTPIGIRQEYSFSLRQTPQISASLWPDSGSEEKQHNYLRQLILDLRQSLEAVGADSVFAQSNYTYFLNTDKIDCDYYAYLKTGKPEFRGEYMSQYEWAENTCGLLWQSVQR